MWKTTVLSLLLKQVIYPWRKGSVSAIIVVINTSADIKWDPFLISLLGHWIFSSAAEMWKGYRCCKFSLHSELHHNWSLSEESTYKTMDLLPVLLHSQQVFFFSPVFSLGQPLPQVVFCSVGYVDAWHLMTAWPWRLALHPKSSQVPKTM